MKTFVNAMMFSVAILATILLGGCPGEDDGDDAGDCPQSSEGCVPRPDAGTDADPLQPDASPDANVDVCGPYEDFAGEWTCQGGGLPYDCTMTFGSWEGDCFLQCGGGGCDAATPDMTTNDLTCPENGWHCWR